MTGSATKTSSFTINEARYVGLKVGADLRLLNCYYGRPQLGDIDNYAEEVAVLLRGGYLKTVDFGFRDAETGDWRLRFRYTATTGGQLRDDRPGSLPATAAMSGLSFYSYLTYSPSYLNLSQAQQQAVRAGLVVVRVGADEPALGLGRTTSGHGYSRNGAGVARDVFTAF
jgi:hypothetical protein